MPPELQSFLNQFLANPLLLLLTGIGAIVALTIISGAALAAGFHLLDREMRRSSRPAGGPPASPAPAPMAPPPPRSATAHRRSGPGAAIFTLILLIAGVLVGRFVPLMPVRASGRAVQVDVLFNTMLGIAAAIFLLVEGVLVYSVFRFRRRKGETGEGLPLHGSDRLEIAWTLVPTLIVLWLGAYSYQTFAQMITPPRNAMPIEVISRQFQWEFRYADSGITSNDLYLPAGKPIRLTITSEDVLHSFWVPAFRVKQDAIPGSQTEAFFTADVPGKYRVVCAELCGAGHATMGLTSYVYVQQPAEFDAWVAQQGAAAGQPPDPLALFAKYGCNTCHTLSAAGATGLVGPNLDGIGTRGGTRVSGVSAEDYLRQSILDPNAVIAPECPAGPCPKDVMAAQDFAARISQIELEALVRFLLEQK